MASEYKNKNRGYQKLRVWHDAIDYYVQELNARAFELENGLLRLVESLEQKQIHGTWIDHLVIRESNVAYVTADNINPNTRSRPRS